MSREIWEVQFYSYLSEAPPLPDIIDNLSRHVYNVISIFVSGKGNSGAIYMHSLSVSSTSGSLSIQMGKGEVLFIVGANGVGKSALAHKIYTQNPNGSKRISANRRVTLKSNSSGINSSSRTQLDKSIEQGDLNTSSRYTDSIEDQKLNAVLYDLVNQENVKDRTVAAYFRNGDLQDAKAEAEKKSPISLINELFSDVSIPISLELDQDNDLYAKKFNSTPYSIVELSDGEKSILLVIAEVLLAKQGSLIVIDEPERHMHRSISYPLFHRIFSLRSDCSFVVPTHDLDFVSDFNRCRALVVRKCYWNGKNVEKWDLDLIEDVARIDSDLKRHILGGQRKILFTEGNENSIDVKIYSLLFPGVSIVPSGNCYDVIRNVKGLNSDSVNNISWLHAFGMIDEDRRIDTDIEKLKIHNVFSLKFYSIESLYYNKTIICYLLTDIFGDISCIDEIEKIVRDEFLSCRSKLVEIHILKRLRESVNGSLPKQEDVNSGGMFSIGTIDIDKVRADEENVFDGYLNESPFDLLLKYPLKKTQVCEKISVKLNFKNSSAYQAHVREKIKSNSEFKQIVIGLLGELPCALGY